VEVFPLFAIWKTFGKLPALPEPAFFAVEVKVIFFPSVGLADTEVPRAVRSGYVTVTVTESVAEAVSPVLSKESLRQVSVYVVVDDG
jgi:hypothetical protein